MSEDLQAGEAQRAADGFELERFIEAQRCVYDRARSELLEGAKQSHWMWYIFPQLRGLGQSAMSQRYGIASGDEARAYLAHPVLGARLIECTQIAVNANQASAGAIFSHPDDLKFRSSMTLFAEVAPEPNVFSAALQKYYAGAPDQETLRLLGS